MLEHACTVYIFLSFFSSIQRCYNIYPTQQTQKSLINVLPFTGQFGASIVALCPKNVGLHSNPAFMLCKPTFESPNLATTTTTGGTKPPIVISNTIPAATTTLTTMTTTATAIGPQIVASDKAAVVEAKKGDEKIFF